MFQVKAELAITFQAVLNATGVPLPPEASVEEDSLIKLQCSYTTADRFTSIEIRALVGNNWTKQVKIIAMYLLATSMSRFMKQISLKMKFAHWEHCVL